MNNEVFSEATLPTAGNAVVYEGKGLHFFTALSKAKGDTALFIKFLIIELVQVNGKILTEKDIDNMHMRDVSYLNELISTMLSNEHLKF